MNRDDRMESLLERQYWVVDMLPKQVPADGEGQYFKIEQYYLESPRKEIICEKYTNILIKLNCYYDFDILFDERWHNNPTPHFLAECVSLVLVPTVLCLSYSILLMRCSVLTAMTQP